ncbi:hypothetical protein [Sutcliffiella halmapala]|uniref:hypothetical protein n=1 Tax=Sutcliffiella halmapala TaxID=79882 RepID=UPI00099576EF|nr:hypothetical protein [Sutcliffiella halmapala]
MINIVYQAIYSTAFHGFLISISIIQGINQLSENRLIGFCYLALATLSFFALTIRHNIRIKDKEIHYWMTVLSLKLINKRVSVLEVRKIEFKRVSWSTKGAFVFYANKRFPLRLVNFKPEEMYEDLHKFAKNNHIPVIMMEDFKGQKREVTENS